MQQKFWHLVQCDVFTGPSSCIIKTLFRSCRANKQTNRLTAWLRERYTPKEHLISLSRKRWLITLWAAEHEKTPRQIILNLKSYERVKLCSFQTRPSFFKRGESSAGGGGGPCLVWSVTWLLACSLGTGNMTSPGWHSGMWECQAAC